MKRRRFEWSSIWSALGVEARKSVWLTSYSNRTRAFRWLGAVTGEDMTALSPKYVLADTLGLTAVRVARVLRTSREAKLVTVRDGHVVFDNFDGLVDLTRFDPGYLDWSGPGLTRT